MDKKEKLLIIGGSGFIGKNLINKVKDKYIITSVTRSSTTKGAHNIHLNVINSDFDFLDKGDFDYIVYLGTTSSPKEAELKPQETFDSHVTTVQKFLEKCKIKKIEKIILLSSSVLYSGDKQSFKEDDAVSPNLSIYNYSKYTMETLADFYRTKYDLPITVFRLANTYGPGQINKEVPYLIPSLFEQGMKDKRLEVWNTSPKRDWVYIDDVVEVLVKELGVKGGGVFNLGTGKATSVGEVARMVANLTGASVYNLNKEVNPPYNVVCSTKKLSKRLGYVPSTSLKDGLKKVFRYLNENT